MGEDSDYSDDKGNSLVWVVLKKCDNRIKNDESDETDDSDNVPLANLLPRNKSLKRPTERPTRNATIVRRKESTSDESSFDEPLYKRMRKRKRDNLRGRKIGLSYEENDDQTETVDNGADESYNEESPVESSDGEYRRPKRRKKSKTESTSEDSECEQTRGSVDDRVKEHKMELRKRVEEKGVVAREHPRRAKANVNYCQAAENDDETNRSATKSPSDTDESYDEEYENPRNETMDGESKVDTERDEHNEKAARERNRPARKAKTEGEQNTNAGGSGRSRVKRSGLSGEAKSGDNSDAEKSPTTGEDDNEDSAEDNEKVIKKSESSANADGSGLSRKAKNRDNTDVVKNANDEKPDKEENEKGIWKSKRPSTRNAHSRTAKLHKNSDEDEDEESAEDEKISRNRRKQSKRNTNLNQSISRNRGIRSTRVRNAKNYREDSDADVSSNEENETANRVNEKDTEDSDDDKPISELFKRRSAQKFTGTATPRSTSRSVRPRKAKSAVDSDGSASESENQKTKTRGNKKSEHEELVDTQKTKLQKPKNNELSDDDDASSFVSCRTEPSQDVTADRSPNELPSYDENVSGGDSNDVSKGKSRSAKETKNTLSRTRETMKPSYAESSSSKSSDSSSSSSERSRNNSSSLNDSRDRSFSSLRQRFSNRRERARL